MKLFTLLPIVFSLFAPNSFAAPAVFSQDTDVQILQANLDFNGVFKFLTGTADPTSVAPETAPKGSVYCRVGASGGSCYVKQDAGVSTNWLAMPTSSGVAGPGSSTDTAIALWNGAGGTALKNSLVTVSAGGSVTIPDGQSYKFNNSGSNAALDWNGANVLLFRAGGVTSAYISSDGIMHANSYFETNNLMRMEFNRIRRTDDGSMVQIGESSANSAVEVSSSVAGTSYSAGMLSVLTNKATNVSVRVQGASAQSADLQQWQSSTPTTLAEITSAGDLNFPASAQGVILKDRSDGHTYRLKVTAGVLGTELVN